MSLLPLYPPTPVHTVIITHSSSISRLTCTHKSHLYTRLTCTRLTCTDVSPVHTRLTCTHVSPVHTVIITHSAPVSHVSPVHLSHLYSCLTCGRNRSEGSRRMTVPRDVNTST